MRRRRLTSHVHSQRTAYRSAPMTRIRLNSTSGGSRRCSRHVLSKRCERKRGSIVAEHDGIEHLRPRLFVFQTDGNQMFGIAEKFDVLNGHIFHKKSTHWINQRTVRCLEVEHTARGQREPS